MSTVTTDLPRRVQLEMLTPAEKAVFDAQRAIEDLPPDQRLTKAGVLLGRARGLVADYVDGISMTIRTGSVLLLLAVPLSAQQTVVVPDVNVEIENLIDSIQVSLTVEMPPPDSAQVARDEAAQRAMDAIADYLAYCGCVNTSPSTVNVVTNVGLTLAAIFIGWQLKRVADKYNSPDIHNTDVDEPPHDNDHGEGYE